MTKKIKKHCITYFHPVLKEIIKQGGDKLKLKENFSKLDLKYYFNKYQLLKRNEYFSKDKEQLFKNVEYQLDVFKKSIINCRHLIFEITEDCNLKCTYCGYGSLYINNKERKNLNLSVDKAKSLINFMVKKWNKNENNSLNKEIRISFYGGEPLLNINFIKEIVDYVKKIKLNFNEFTFGMTTNATLLAKYMDYLKDNDFSLAISLDGNKKNNSFRVFKDGKSSYSLIKNNIMRLNNKYPEYFKEKISFLSVLHKHNSIEDIYLYFKKIEKDGTFLPLSREGIKKSQVNVINNMFVDAESNLSKSKAFDIIKINHLFQSPIREKVKNFLFYTSDYFFNSKEDLVNRKESLNINTTGTCIPLSTNIFLNARGEIYPCEKSLSIDPIGIVTNNKVRINFKKINKKINIYLEKLSNQCSRCSHSITCRICILQIGIEENNFKCKRFYNEQKYKKKLVDIMECLEKNPELYQKFAYEL